MLLVALKAIKMDSQEYVVRESAHEARLDDSFADTEYKMMLQSNRRPSDAY